MQILPTTRQLVALNQSLPEPLRDRSVALQFVEPVPLRLTEQFYRIRLTPQMLAAGEEDFFMPQIAQPHRVGTQLCPSCGCQMRRLSLTMYRCESLRCLISGPHHTCVSGPTRGVVSIRTEFEATFSGRAVRVSFAVGWERQTTQRGRITAVPIVSGCLLLLDRRYRVEVIAAVYRTAGQLCEDLRAVGINIAVR